jgi:hypothetical protein
MKNAAKEIIYGVCDKTNKNDSYFGFFKNLEDAQKEILIQGNRLKEDLGIMDIAIKNDRAFKPVNEQEEDLLIVIHKYVLR